MPKPVVIDLTKDELVDALKEAHRRQMLAFAGFDPDNLPKLKKKKK